ncbi:M16 family metallopeptidase [Bacteroidota bacterium]
MRSLMLFLLFALLFSSCTLKTRYVIKVKTDNNGFTYEKVTNDPSNLRIYTLDNGLRVYLSENKIEPKIQTIIAVKVGGVDDPDDNTGLAHYFEHLMFKGTQNIGTVDFEKEEILLDEISQLYEEHKAENDLERKKYIYKKIDSISHLAAKFAIAGEYEKMISSLGAEGTNAFTSTEMTCYINTVPSNEINKWLTIEAERFSNPVIRLFHTELETVYEEYNMGQDNDGNKTYDKINQLIFGDHRYGTRDVIGKPEHLKNPSINAIYDFYNRFYVPNNMAVIFSGDFNSDSMIVKINNTFGQFQHKEIVKTELKEIPALQEIKKAEVYGPQMESILFAYRMNGIKSSDKIYVEIINQLLNNRTAGAFQLNLMQEQKLLFAYSYTNFMKQYGTHTFGGGPKEDQTLDEVVELIRGEIEKIKNGEFDEDMLSGIIKNLRIERIKKYEQNWRAYFMMDAFINDIPWKEELESIDVLERITKEEIIAFAQKKYQDNYALVYKKQGEDTNKVVVEKPIITPIDLNRDSKSEFSKQISEIETPRLTPDFFKYGEDMKIHTLDNGLEVDYVKNDKNDLFDLYISFEYGSLHSKSLPVALGLLDKLGTSKYSPREFKLELFKNGLTLTSFYTVNNSFIQISGLQESFNKALELANHLMREVQPDSVVYAEQVKDIIKSRENQKTNRWIILYNALYNYSKFGPNNPNTFLLSEEELNETDPKVFTDLIHQMCNYKHRIFYYGPEDESGLLKSIEDNYLLSDYLTELPVPELSLKEMEYNEPQVFFVHYDIVQSMIILLGRANEFNPDIFKVSDLFNIYYGEGLTSIVFQEIREKQGLAYIAYGNYRPPIFPDQSMYILAILSTQPDKMDEALSTMKSILSEMPKSEVQFTASKESLLKGIEAERHESGRHVFWTYIWHQNLGMEQNNREDVYNSTKELTLEDLEIFFNEHIKDKSYNYLVVGDKNKVDKELLSQYGEMKELDLEEIFGF